MLTNDNCLFCGNVLPQDINPIPTENLKHIFRLAPEWGVPNSPRPVFMLGEPRPLYVQAGSSPPLFTPMVIAFYVDDPKHHRIYLRCHLDCFKENASKLDAIIACIHKCPPGYASTIEVTPPPPAYAVHDAIKTKAEETNFLLNKFPATSQHWQKFTAQLRLARYLWAREEPLTTDAAREELKLHWLQLFHSLKNSQERQLGLDEQRRQDAPTLPNLLDMTIEGHNISVVFQTPRPWRPFARPAPQTWQPILPLFAVP